jgi:hypothetical protein
MTQSLLSLTLYKERLEVPKWVWEQQETVSDDELIVDWLNRKHANLNIDKYCLSKDKDFIYFNIHPKHTPTVYVKDYNNSGVLFETLEEAVNTFISDNPINAWISVKGQTTHKSSNPIKYNRLVREYLTKVFKEKKLYIVLG